MGSRNLTSLASLTKELIIFDIWQKRTETVGNPIIYYSIRISIQRPTANKMSDIVTETNLLPKLVCYLDRHLIYPLLQFVADQEEEPSIETTRAMFELLKKTNMTDYVSSLCCQLEGIEEPPKEYNEKKTRIVAELERYVEETQKIIDLLGREDVVNNFRSDKVANMDFLKNQHGVSDWL